MKRLIIVYSLRSSRYELFEREVLEPARKLKGWMVGKFEVREASVEENVRELVGQIRSGDLVVAAGGDGTAGMVVNAVMESGKRVAMGVVGLGNFNDYAQTFGEGKFLKMVRKFEEGRKEEIYPMEILVNGKHFRYFVNYLTMGMFAESTEVFKNEKVRKKLGKVKNRLVYSGRKLFFWYLKNKRKKFLPEEMGKGVTDFMVVNGASVAGLFPTGEYFLEREKFLAGKLENRNFWKMLRTGMRALEGKKTLEESTEVRMTFKKPETMKIHTEGEGVELASVREIVIKKAESGLKVIRL